MQEERKNTPQLQVAVKGPDICLKISGRATFVQSMDFKRVLSELSDRGFVRFHIDLAECQNMDSTFLGVLAGVGLKYHTSSQGQNTTGLVKILNPSERLSDLLDNLGISHLFDIEKGVCPFECGDFSDVEKDGSDKTELTRNCLEAHQTLMNICPDNVIKFKDVANFLAEDLKKLENENRSE